LPRAHGGSRLRQSAVHRLSKRDRGNGNCADFVIRVIGLDHLGAGGFHDYEVSLLASIDFSNLLMQGMLSLLLFAGALHIDVSALKSVWWQVGILAGLAPVPRTAFDLNLKCSG
jgi:hypothetical protein